VKIAMIGAKGIPAASGGVERHVEELGARLAEKGHTVTVYNRRGYGDRCAGRYRSVNIRQVFTIKNKYLEAPVYSFLAAIKAVADGQELIHFHALGPAMMSFLPRIFGRKTVVTVHGLDWKRAKWGAVARLYLKLCGAAAAVFPHGTIVVSNKLKDYFSLRYEKRAQKIEYIPNGVTGPSVPESRGYIEKYGLEEKNYILFLARLVPEKGCHTLLQAFSGLDCDTKLVIAGGSSHSDAYCRKLYRYASDNIIFVGEVFGDELRELFGCALFYVLPSETEGMPISLLEAMSYGVCPLVSDIEENLEIVSQRGGCGYSFKKGDTEDLKNTLRYMLSHPKEVSAKGDHARRCACEAYDWDAVADKTEALYQKTSLPGRKKQHRSSQ